MEETGGPVQRPRSFEGEELVNLPPVGGGSRCKGGAAWRYSSTPDRSGDGWNARGRDRAGAERRVSLGNITSLSWERVERRNRRATGFSPAGSTSRGPAVSSALDTEIVVHQRYVRRRHGAWQRQLAGGGPPVDDFPAARRCGGASFRRLYDAQLHGIIDR
jgi:hypothetical protein